MDSRLLLMHQAMLADRPRLAAYEAALAAAVQPGDVVVDVGAGTLVLTMQALRHGAAHVFALEADPQVAAVARGIVADNGVTDRVTVMPGDARLARLPVKADVVVSELMGNLGPEEEMVELVGAVARRHLRPGGRVVPRRLVTSLTALQFDGEGWGVWSEDHLGYRVDAVLDAARPEAQLHFFQRPPVLLGPAVPVADAVLGRTVSGRPERRHWLPIDRPGTVHAVLGHFRADLGAGVELANFPSYPGCNWAVWIWPLRHMAVQPGDALVVAVEVPRRGARDVTGWRLDCGLERGEARRADLRRLGA